MCIAAYIPAGSAQNIKEETLWNCFDINRDGIGYAFIRKEKLISKVFFHVNPTEMYYKFLKEFKKDVDDNLDSPFILHFRASSAGTLGLENCHPFRVSEDQVFIHNGTITKVKDDPTKQKSDTAMFNTEIMKKLPTNWSEFPVISTLLDDYIGGGKLIFLNSDKSYTIIGENRGYWDQGIWWSNKHYTGSWSRNAHGNAVFNTWPNQQQGNPNIGFNSSVSPGVNELHCDWCDSLITKADRSIYIDQTNVVHQVCSRSCKGEIEEMFGPLTDSDKVDPALISIYKDDNDIPLLTSGMEH